MDVEESSVAPSSEEIDQNLLLQFSCLNTSDRDELISQVQKLLGPSVNHNTASFFLDMNSWNLQAAVCSYLDYFQSPKLPSMTIELTQGPEEPLPPAARFDQGWRIVNTGTDSWPARCQVIQVGGESLGTTGMYVPALEPGQSYFVSLKLTAPSSEGKHRAYFHLLTDRGDQFGETLWSTVTVELENTMAIVQQMAALPVPSRRDDEPGNSSFQQATQPDDQMC